MKTIIAFLSSLLSFLTNWLFGVRATGEKLPKPTLRTTKPNDEIEVNKWFYYIHTVRD